MHASRHQDNLQKILARNVDSAIQGKKEAQQNLCEAEAEARNWEKRNRDHSFQEFNQEFESQRFGLNEAIQQADQAEREKISL